MLPVALKLAAFVPDIIRLFTKSNTAGAVAEKVVDIARTVTGHSNPDAAAQAIEANPTLALQFKTAVMAHTTELEALANADAQAAHGQQQDTIRAGDAAEDEYVRRTRPKMARESWYVTAVYVLAAEAAHAAKLTDTGASLEMAMLLASPAMAYIGFRSMFDKGGVLGMFGRKTGAK